MPTVRLSLLTACLLGLLPLVALAPAHAADEGPLRFPDTPRVERTVAGQKVEIPVHEYGVVAQDAELVAEIPYTNVGSAPVRDIRISSGCSCFGATVTSDELPAGGRGVLTVRFRSGAMKGTVEKPLRLLYRVGQEEALAELRLSAKVIAGVLVERAWFGEVRAGAKPSAKVPVAWFHGVGTPFEITEIEVPGPRMATRVEPYQIGDGSTYRGWTIEFTFLESPPLGVYSRSAILHTTHPDEPMVAVPLSATVVGSLWVQTSRLYLGLVPAGQTRSAAVKITASGKDAAPLENVEVRLRGKVLRVAVTDGMDPFVGPHKVITVTVPADAPEGSLDDVIEVRASIAPEEVTEIPVLGRVYAPVGPK
ncbi:MAG: DUF1573 domain-containing protein [Planctomycetota bacterium]|nr:DUF1573 domain-containing protein [Planctomycetota bacterium]